MQSVEKKKSDKSEQKNTENVFTDDEKFIIQYNLDESKHRWSRQWQVFVWAFTANFAILTAHFLLIRFELSERFQKQSLITYLFLIFSVGFYQVYKDSKEAYKHWLAAKKIMIKSPLVKNFDFDEKRNFLSGLSLTHMSLLIGQFLISIYIFCNNS